MTSPRDLDHVLGKYFEDGPTELPDRSYDDVRTAIEITKQRVVFGPWRFQNMSLVARIASLSAMVLALTLAGVYLVPRPLSVGGPAVTPSPIVTPTLTPSVSPLPVPEGEGGAPLQAGTYLTQDPFLARVTFTLPDGPIAWQGNMGGPFAVFLGDASSNLLLFQVFNSVYSDPCPGTGQEISPNPGSSVDDLVTALAGLPGLTVTPPTDVTLGGVKGKLLTMTAPATSGCQVWVLPLGATNDMVPGEQQRVWILDVSGQRLVVDAPATSATTADMQAAVQSVLDSLQIAPVTVPASPSPAAPSSAVAPTPSGS
jgi:hypothetical protein